MEKHTLRGSPPSERDSDLPIDCICERARDQIERFRVAHNTQVLTIFFSDVVGSTRQQSRLGNERAAELIQRYRAVLRDTLTQFDGQEVETAGDSFLIVFATPSEGVSFALKLQAAIRAERRRDREFPECRIGLHLGQVVKECHGSGPKAMDIYGAQVSIASRIMNLGRGGQILCSRPVYEDARRFLQDGTVDGIGKLKWRIHGTYWLRNVDMPQEVGEVGEKKYAPFARPTGHVRSLVRLVLGLAALAVVALLGLAVVGSMFPVPNSGGTEAKRRESADIQNRMPDSERLPERAEMATEKAVDVMTAVGGEQTKLPTADLGETLQNIDYPGCAMVARVAADEPKILEQTGTTATVEWPLEIRFDEDAYFDKVLPKLTKYLESAAREKSDGAALISGKASTNTGADFHKVVLGAVFSDPSFRQAPSDKSSRREHQVGVVVKKNAAGDSLHVANFPLTKDAFGTFLDWIRPVDRRFQSIPTLRIEWLDSDGNAVVEDEVRLSKTEAGRYALKYGVSQGAYLGFVPDVGIRLGPFFYADTPAGVEYFATLRCPYRREVSLDDLKRVAKIKCNFVGRSDAKRP
jgi:class 3 adenylate cyclase